MTVVRYCCILYKDLCSQLEMLRYLEASHNIVSEILDNAKFVQMMFVLAEGQRSIQHSEM